MALNLFMKFTNPPAQYFTNVKGNLGVFPHDLLEFLLMENQTAGLLFGPYCCGSFRILKKSHFTKIVAPPDPIQFNFMVLPLAF